MDWSQEEFGLFFDAIKSYGRDFVAVASRLPRKTPEQARDLYASTLARVDALLHTASHEFSSVPETTRLVAFWQLSMRTFARFRPTGEDLYPKTFVNILLQSFGLTPRKESQLRRVQPTLVSCNVSANNTESVTLFLAPRDNETLAFITMRGQNPKIEIIVKHTKSIASILKHLRGKWQLEPHREIRLYAANNTSNWGPEHGEAPVKDMVDTSQRAEMYYIIETMCDDVQPPVKRPRLSEPSESMPGVNDMLMFASTRTSVGPSGGDAAEVPSHNHPIQRKRILLVHGSETHYSAFDPPPVTASPAVPLPSLGDDVSMTGASESRDAFMANFLSQYIAPVTPAAVLMPPPPAPLPATAIPPLEHTMTSLDRFLADDVAAGSSASRDAFVATLMSDIEASQRPSLTMRDILMKKVVAPLTMIETSLDHDLEAHLVHDCGGSVATFLR